MSVPAGFVACRSSNRRVLLHLVRDDQARTLCGLYKPARFLPEDSSAAGPATPVCGRCADRKERKDARVRIWSGES